MDVHAAIDLDRYSGRKGQVIWVSTSLLSKIVSEVAALLIAGLLLCSAKRGVT